jgi:hypothetical protein
MNVEFVRIDKRALNNFLNFILELVIISAVPIVREELAPIIELVRIDIFIELEQRLICFKAVLLNLLPHVF